MKLAFVAPLLLGSGCLWANEKSVSDVGFDARVVLGTDGHVEGGSAQTMGGYAGVAGAAEVTVRDAVQAGDPATYHAAAVGISARASLFGILATDHELERYFDFGGEAGASLGAALGSPLHGHAFMPTAWYGAWVELGTFPVENGYLAVTGGIRREVAGDLWFDQTQLTIGIAWRKRERISLAKQSWHD
jgi:hypothetical protein